MFCWTKTLKSKLLKLVEIFSLNGPLLKNDGVGKIDGHNGKTNVVTGNRFLTGNSHDKELVFYNLFTSFENLNGCKNLKKIFATKSNFLVNIKIIKSI